MTDTNVETHSPMSLRALPRRQLIFTFMGLILAMFLSSLDQTVVGTAMPRIIAELKGFNHYTWVTTAYIITSAIAIPIVGKLIDMYGRKWFYIVGIFIFLAGSALCGSSQNMTQLIAYRGFQGIGAGMMMATAFVIVSDLFPPSERGKYQGYISGIFAIATVVGPTIGGFLTDSLSWRWVFFINLPLGIFVIFLLFRFFPNFRPDNLRHSIDFAGLLTLILCVVPAMLALTWGGTEYPWRSPQIIGMFAFSAIMAGLFVLVESRAREPIIPLSLFRNNIVLVSIIVTFFISIGMFGSVTFIPLFFQGVLGASATSSGNFMIPMMAGVLTGSIISGQLLSRAGGHYKILGLIGTALMCAGIFLFSRMDANTSYATAVRNMVVTGLGLGTTMPVFMIGVQNAVPYREMGVATSTTTFFRSIGGSVGLAILGSVMTNRFAANLSTNIPQNVTNSLPPGVVEGVAHNPQALLSPAARDQLQQVFSQVSDPTLFGQFLAGLRHALASAISEVFFIGLIIVLLGLATCLFLKEIPLQKRLPAREMVQKKPVEQEG